MNQECYPLCSDIQPTKSEPSNCFVAISAFCVIRSEGLLAAV